MNAVPRIPVPLTNERGGRSPPTIRFRGLQHVERGALDQPGVGAVHYVSLMATRRHWVIVASRDHARRGVNDGFVTANHGKRSPLARMSPGDGVLIYSPTTYPTVSRCVRSPSSAKSLETSSSQAR